MFTTIAIIAIAACGLGAMLLSLYRDPEARHRRALRGAASTSIREFADGDFGKVVGLVDKHESNLTAPISQRACVYYALSIAEERVHDGGSQWRELVHDTSAQNFLIKDQTATALVLLDGARLSLIDQDSHVVGKFVEFPEDVQKVLLSYPRVAPGIAADRTLRCREKALEPGMLVAVLGYGVFQPDPDPSAAPGGYRQAASQLVMQGRRGQPLLVSNDPKVTSS